MRMYLPSRFSCSCLFVAMWVASMSPLTTDGAPVLLPEPPRAAPRETPSPRDNPRESPSPPSRGSPRFLAGALQDAFFRVPHRLRKLRHRRGFRGDPSAKRSPRFANHNDPVFLTLKNSGRNLIVTDDGKVAISRKSDINPKSGEILRQVVGDNPPIDVISHNTNIGQKSFIAKYYLKAKKTNRYICMKGRRYFSSETPVEECKFIVMDHANNYQSYCSAADPMQKRKRRCIGSTKKGKLKRVKPGDDKGFFLSRHVTRTNTQTIPPPYNPDFGDTLTTPRTRPREGSTTPKPRRKRPKKQQRKCEEDTLFSRKCRNRSPRFRGWSRNRRGRRRRIPIKRPLNWDRSSSSPSTFFSNLPVA